MAIDAGDLAPDFSTQTDAGAPFSLGDLRGKTVVLYFYPRADTPGCTVEACGIRDEFAGFQRVGAEVLGISPDAPAKQLKFDEKYKLGFPLLADEEHAVAEKYGVWGEKINYGKKYMGIIRSAFVVDAKGKIAGAFYKVSPKDTVPKTKAVIEG